MKKNNHQKINSLHSNSSLSDYKSLYNSIKNSKNPKISDFCTPIKKINMNQSFASTNTGSSPVQNQILLNSEKYWMQSVSKNTSFIVEGKDDRGDYENRQLFQSMVV